MFVLRSSVLIPSAAGRLACIEEAILTAPFPLSLTLSSHYPAHHAIHAFVLPLFHTTPICLRTITARLQDQTVLTTQLHPCGLIQWTQADIFLNPCSRTRKQKIDLLAIRRHQTRILSGSTRRAELQSLQFASTNYLSEMHNLILWPFGCCKKSRLIISWKNILIQRREPRSALFPSCIRSPIQQADLQSRRPRLGDAQHRCDELRLSTADSAGPSHEPDVDSESALGGLPPAGLLSHKSAVDSESAVDPESAVDS
jgi:hypothetical protein